MGGALLAVEQAIDQLVLDHDAPSHRRRGFGQQGLGGAGRLAGHCKELHSGISTFGFVQHRPISRAVALGEN